MEYFSIEGIFLKETPSRGVITKVISTKGENPFSLLQNGK